MKKKKMKNNTKNGTLKPITAVLFATMLITALIPPACAVTQPDIDDAIDDGIQWLRQNQNIDGSWGWSVGETAFAVLALLNEGYDETDANVSAGINYILSRQNADGSIGSYRYYETGLGIMALVATGNQAAYLGNVTAGADYILSVQNTNPTDPGYGGWGYSSPGWIDWDSDNSVTQFNTLGLHSAGLWGYTVPSSNWTLCANWVMSTQNATDGGFDYGRWDSPSYGSMTAAALISLLIALDDPTNQSIVDGFDWMCDNWNVTKNIGYGGRSGPMWPEWHYYFLYSAMKAFELADMATLSNGTVVYDWYWDDEPYGMADYLVNHQQSTGRWVSSVPDWSIEMTTAEAILILQKTIFPVDVDVEVPDMACSDTGYTVTVDYSVERYTVDGTLTITKDGAAFDTVTLDDFTGEATYTNTLASDTSGTHVYRAVLDVTSDTGTTREVEDTDSVQVFDPPVASVDLILPAFGEYGVPYDITVDYSNAGTSADGTLTITKDGAAFDTVTLDDFTGGATYTNSSTDTAGEEHTYEAVLTLVNVAGCTDTASDEETISFNRPPDASDAYPSISCLWPPNHKFVDITILNVTDPDGDTVTIIITNITSDEPTASIDGAGGDKHAPDADGVGTDTASVRAERSGTGEAGKDNAGPGNGRVYEITFVASDGIADIVGNVTVCVPHDYRGKCDCTLVIDDGQNYDATVIN
ncbi:MAG: prenyltransferase/squalene oxidase repeat-containing protein [Halobacteriota archaeon]